jgi:formylglycine-generating enzyme required for sulfatase activity
MAVIKHFFVQKNGHAEELGPFTLDQLRDRFGKGEITPQDSFRDAANLSLAYWRLIKDSRSLMVALGRSDRAAERPAAPRSSDTGHTLPLPARVPIQATSPVGSDGRRLRKNLLSVVIPSLALLLTLLNTGWLLLAKGDADEPATAKARPPKLTGDGEVARKDALRPPKEQNATLDDIMMRLDLIDERLARIDHRTEAASSGNSICQAMEGGVLEFRVTDTAFRFIFVPAGTFRFGYPAEEQNRVVQATGNPNSFLNATPECVVNVVRGFFMLDREITVAQWNACVGGTASKPAPATTGQEQTPLEAPKRNVSWVEAQSFCAALQKAVPRLSADACQVRLPTEIEWEYAGRGSQSLTFPWVPQAGPAQRFLGSAKGMAVPIAVDPLTNKDLSWRGQFDFAGNLSEWCLDPYDQSLHEALGKRQIDSVVNYDPASDPIVATALVEKMDDRNPTRPLRGGSIIDGPEACELPMRRFLLQNKAAEHIGFRPVVILKKTGLLTAEEKQQ